MHTRFLGACFLMNSYSSRGHVFSCVLTKPQMCILYNNWPDQHLGLCIPGKASVATTVAATDEAARTNALEGLAMSKLSPVTPPHLIRRNNTPTILHGSVGDQAILQPATGNSTGSKSKASRPRHLKRNQRAKKNRLSAAKSKAARPDTTDAATAPVPVSHAVPEVPDASGSDAANEIQPPPETTAAPQQSGPRDGSPASVRTHAYTATADGMPVPASVGQNKASLPPMLLVKKEPKEPVTLPGLKTTTPTSQRRATHVAHAKNENMQRANTQDLAQPAGTPSATPANANAPPPKCSAPPPRPTTWQPHHKIVYTDDAENNINHPSEYPQDFLDTLADAEDQSQNNTNGTVSTGGGPPDEPGDRRKKVKTAHQKAMHARYMRFSRSLKSNLSAIKTNSKSIIICLPMCTYIHAFCLIRDIPVLAIIISKNFMPFVGLRHAAWWELYYWKVLHSIVCVCCMCYVLCILRLDICPMWNTHTRAPKHFGYHTLDCNNLLVTSSGAKTPVEIRRAGKSAAYCDLVWKSIRTYTHKCDTYVWDYMSAIYLYFWAGCLGVQITYIHGLHILCTYVASESFEHRILFAASIW